MSASGSTSDLHPLIRASPVLYRVFRPAKRIVLLNILTRDLGPAALQDGIAAALAARYSLRDLLGAGLLAKNTRDNYHRIRATALSYRGAAPRPQGAADPAAPAAPEEAPPARPRAPRRAVPDADRLRDG
ncbi:uncharacterized protein PG986_013733 [Apiospora aurea]|uniref:Uncharacterized protein n=1 Tax=Apiospora aurea TaxID=335848 RepID=A0ABR1PWY8_9PEZI